MDAFFLSFWTWVYNPAHLIEVGTLGCLAGQFAIRLPAKFPYKTQIVNALHGLFPSPQVFVNGAMSELSNIEKLAPLLEQILVAVTPSPSPVPVVAPTTPAPPPVPSSP